MGIFLSVIITLFLGIIIGFITGKITIGLKVPALIVTLGMLYIYRGLNYQITKMQPVLGLPESLKIIGYGGIFRIPYLVIIAAVLGVITHIILQYTKFGYDVHVVGGNKLAAIAAGININRIKITLFMISGLFCAIAGILVIARISAGRAVTGEGYEMYVLASIIIGGVSLFGGIGSVFGTFLGALLLTLQRDIYNRQFLQYMLQYF